ncbi:MAG: hypothetical protein M3178_12615 [Pseudomonadota bacterium]|nr:hypothetical protein [Pseudomonadota bacterium]
MKADHTQETLSDGEFFDKYADMMAGEQLLAMLNRRCWQEGVLDLYLALDKQFREDPKAQQIIARIK